jgi:hypothetical protein
MHREMRNGKFPDQGIFCEFSEVQGIASIDTFSLGEND